MKNKNQKIDYGNWMPKKICIGSFILGILSIIFAYIVNLKWAKILFIIFSCVFIITGFFCLAAYYRFSNKGKNCQGEIHDLLIEKLAWDGNGTCLDVGCGGAAVSVKIAKKYPQAKIIAGDYWGNTEFDYSQKQCEINAKLEKVDDKIEFKNINAAKLPFENESLDAIVSNFVYHEVKDFKMKEKYKAVLESIRVLKKGGVFAVQDIFNSKSHYGDFSELYAILEKSVSELNWIDSTKIIKIPIWMKSRLMLGGIGIFYGVK